jgi:hypothetical protein
MIFQLLQQDHWIIKQTKCSFARTQIAYLGYVISAQGVSTSPDKVQVVVDWLVPTLLKS